MTKTYIKNGVEYNANGTPSTKNILTNSKQLLALARWEREVFNGRVSVQTTGAMIHFISRLKNG